jgi:hypothetical protein
MNAAWPKRPSLSVEEMTINLHQAAQLAAMFNGTEADVTVRWCDGGHSGPGLYAHFTGHPEEGSFFLDPNGSTTR